MADLSFNVGLAQPYTIPLGVGGAASTTPATSGSSANASSSAQGVSGDTVKISPTAVLLQASANAALLAATLGGTAAVSYSVDPGSSSSSASPSASALTQLQATNPVAAQQLGNELTLLK